MAEPFDTLMVVQDHDTAIDQMKRRIETLPERQELSTLRAEHQEVTGALARIQVQVDDLKRRQAELEALIATSAQRRHDIEARMQSGVSIAPRDLEAMDHEVHQLTERQAHLEEDELLLLEEEEPLDAEVSGHETRLAELEARAKELEVAARLAEAEIVAAMGVEQARRDEMAAGLPGELRDRYELLRVRLGGVGAARLVGAQCTGCHLTLPSGEIDQIRKLPAESFATCPQCDRILVH